MITIKEVCLSYIRLMYDTLQYVCIVHQSKILKTRFFCSGVFCPFCLLIDMTQVHYSLFLAVQGPIVQKASLASQSWGFFKSYGVLVFFC